MPRETALGVIASVQLYARSAMTLHARLPLPDDPAVPQVAELSRQVGTAMGRLSRTLRDRIPAPVQLPLRDVQTAMRAVLGAGSELLVSETDAMVDAVDTIHHLLADTGADTGSASAGRP
jgi:hypothetical protein